MVMSRKLNPIDLRERLYRRRYILPNLVTLASMFCGFLAIIYAATARHEKAVIAIGLAILFDGLDGRVARRFNATSKFGGEFDSFADFVSFGVAPAMVVYHWGFRALADEWGVFVSFMFALGAATRLARFNLSAENLKTFQGLPTPAAAGLVAATVHYAPDLKMDMIFLTVASVLMLLLAFLMVSKVEFVSIKKIQIQHLPLPVFVAMGALIALIWYNHQLGLLCLAAGYVASGPCIWVMRRKGRSVTATPPNEGARTVDSSTH